MPTLFENDFRSEILVKSWNTGSFQQACVGLNTKSAGTTNQFPRAEVQLTQKTSKVAIAVFVVTLVAICFFWIRSVSHSDRVSVHYGDTLNTSLSSTRGAVNFTVAEGIDPFTDGFALYWKTETLSLHREAWQGDPPKHGKFGLQIGYPFHEIFGVGPKYGWTSLQLPHWLLAVTSLLLLFPVLLRLIVAQRMVPESGLVTDADPAKGTDL